MRINDNGVYRDMTPEEVAEMEKAAAEMPAVSPSLADRVADVELMLAELIGGAV